MSTIEIRRLLRAADLFADLEPEVLDAVAEAVAFEHLPGGAWLFHQGDEGCAFFIVSSGRVEVVRDGTVVAVLGPGDSMGEAALLHSGRRNAGIRARRDSELLRLDVSEFSALLRLPAFAHGLLRRMSSRETPTRPVTDVARGDPGITRRTTIALAHTDAVDPQPTIERLEAALRGLGRLDVVREAELAEQADDTVSGGGISRRLDAAEQAGHMVLLDAGHPDSAFAQMCARQTDRRLLLVDRGGPPARLATTRWAGCDLVTVGAAPLSSSVLRRLPETLGDVAHHRLRPAHQRADVERLARRITGRAVGVVLSGGGARGYAHVGVLRALEEAGVVVDRWGGTSMGAFVSALAACGHSSHSLEALLERELVAQRPFADWTLPRHGLIRGRRAAALLHRVLPVDDIRQLITPWFGVSASLSTAQEIVHRDGPLWHAVGCSMSLPGIAPPRRHLDHVVVDGAVLNNLPVDVMAADGEGPVIGVDVGRQAVLAQDGLPSISEVLVSTIGMSSRLETERRRALATLLVEPPLERALLDWDDLMTAVQAGYDAGRSALASADATRRSALGLR